MEYDTLINEIKNKSQEDFILWYTKTIKYTTNLNEFIKDGVNDSAYKIFCQVLNNDIENGALDDLQIQKLFAPEADHFYFYVDCCKEELIQKILKLKNN